MVEIDLETLTAATSAARLASGEITSEALVSACLDRIAALEPQVQAWAFLDRERALEQAKAADQVRREGRGVGPLHGVPVGIKDIIDTADMPTEHGSAAFKGRMPTKDATCITALRRAGAIIMGKTVTTEMATMTPSVTRNPRNLEHTPGGSSSGSAAAVAAAMVPAALGTQTGGSVIRPAAFCGVYGFKPTFGVIPRPGVLTQAHSLDTVGVLARCVEDLAFLTDVLQGYDERDHASLSTSRPQLLAAATEPWPLPPMVAFVRTHAWGSADKATHDAFGELVELLGPQVQEVDISATTERGLASARTVQSVELATYYGPVLDRAPDLVSKQLAARIEEGRRVTGTAYVAALNAREDHNKTIEEIANDYGAILTPAALGTAPKGFGSTGDPVFCGFWTYLGVPAVSLPLLEVDGLPMGVQLVGARRDDGRLLRTARVLVKFLSDAEG